LKKGEAEEAFEPPKAVSAGLTIRYNVPRPKAAAESKEAEEPAAA